tara:strand:- start:78 stop:554 length:477 start_codon:yes stop_codon:yes gene_type:complete
MIYHYGKGSEARLNTCHYDLQRIARMALSIGLMDISVICGNRSKEEQNALYPACTSVKFPNSKHNSLPSMAIDLAPYHPVYGYLSGHKTQINRIAGAENISYAEAHCFIASEYNRLAGIVLSCAKHLNIKLRWGGDWNSNNNTLDQSLVDLPHFELTN